MSEKTSPIVHPLNMGDVLAYGYVGSRLYGLVDDQSDIDLAVIGLAGTPTTHVLRDNMDYRLYSLNSFLERLNDTRLSETDLLMSGTLVFENTGYEPYFKAFRVNANKYMAGCEKIVGAAFKVVSPNLTENYREYKLLKNAIRSGILGNRMDKYRNHFNPVFTESQKEIYWNLVEEYTERFRRGENRYKMLHHLNVACSSVA